MSSRTRQSTTGAMPRPSRSSVASTPRRNIRDDLPPYRKPAHPLDHEAQRELRILKDAQIMRDLKEHNKKALATIQATGESVNDMLSDHTQYFEKRVKKWEAGKRLETKESEEKTMHDLQERVDQATVKLEESMRAMIDSGMAAHRIDEALDWLRHHGPATIDSDYATQTQRSQRQSQRRATQNTDGEDDEDGEDLDAPTPGPTPLDGSRIALTGASEIFAARMERKKNEWTSMSLTARYARNNDYRNFKGVVHDAKYGDSGPDLGHEDTWFTVTGSPAPGITNAHRGEFDDDDDIIMDKATISTRCPLTFQSFQDPVTSTKCPHTFEKSAIMDMIRASATRLGGGAVRALGEKSVSCPVTGCDQILTAKDLRTDPVLVRKIARMQAAEHREAEDSSGDEGETEHRRVEVRDEGERIDDDSDTDTQGAAAPPRRTPNVKPERRELSEDEE